jgi:hypothetical protein
MKNQNPGDFQLIREVLNLIARGEQPYDFQLGLALLALDRIEADQPAATETCAEIAKRISPIDGKPIGAKRYGGSTTPVAGAETPARGTPQAHNINGHVFIDGAGIDFPYTNCDKCGIQFGARYTRACEVGK